MPARKGEPAKQGLQRSCPAGRKLRRGGAAACKTSPQTAPSPVDRGPGRQRRRPPEGRGCCGSSELSTLCRFCPERTSPRSPAESPGVPHPPPPPRQTPLLACCCNVGVSHCLQPLPPLTDPPVLAQTPRNRARLRSRYQSARKAAPRLAGPGDPAPSPLSGKQEPGVPCRSTSG